jgi:hypothetical protein
MRFRVLRGCHAQNDPATGRPVEYYQGDVLESDSDLATRFNSGLGKKFDRVPDDTPVTVKGKKANAVPVADKKASTIPAAAKP